MEEDTTYHEQLSIDTKLSAFQLQNILQATGILIPTDVIIPLYARANVNKNKRNGDAIHTDDCSGELSIADMSHFLKETVGEKKDFTFKVLKNLAMDINFWLPLLYFVAGVLLVINSFAGGSIPSPIRSNMSLTVSIFYYINSGRFIFGFPFNEWRAQVKSEDSALQFKEAMLMKAITYEQSKTHNTRLSMSFNVLSPNFIQLLAYIEEELYERNPQNVLTKRDLEMLLLRELGGLYTQRVLNDVLTTIVDKNNSGTISPVEFHHFLLTSRSEVSATSKLFFQRAWSVLMITTTDLTWLMSTCFFLGSFLAFLNNVVQRFGKDLSPILGDLSPALVIAWLFLVGSGAFTHMSYKILHDTFDGKEHAKEVLGACVRYASYYHHDSAEIWIKYNANNGLDKMSLFRLLEESYIIIMPESEIDELFQEIDVDCNGVLCKDKIEAYLDVGLLNRQIASFSFWSNFSWFLGSIAYIIPLYINDSITAKVCDILGSLGYWIGGINLCLITYVTQARYLSEMAKLNEVIKKLILKTNRITSSFRNKSHRFRSIDNLSIMGPKIRRFSTIVHHHPSGGINEETSRLQGSQNLTSGLFGEEGIMPSELEVNLPLQKNSRRVISLPKSISSSQDVSGPVIAHFELSERVQNKSIARNVTFQISEEEFIV